VNCETWLLNTEVATTHNYKYEIGQINQMHNPDWIRAVANIVLIIDKIYTQESVYY
jgi:hypothetical protein